MSGSMPGTRGVQRYNSRFHCMPNAVPAPDEIIFGGTNDAGPPGVDTDPHDHEQGGRCD
jgi:hypothetical protein